MFHYLRVAPMKGTGSQFFVLDIIKNLLKSKKKVFLIDWTCDYSVFLDDLNPNVITYSSFDELESRIDNRLLQIICINYTLNNDIKKLYDKSNSLINNIIYNDFESYRNCLLRNFFNKITTKDDLDYILEIKDLED